MIGADWDLTDDYENALKLKEAYQQAEGHNRALENARAEMEYQSLHDSLTNLPNRRSLDNILRTGAGADSRTAVIHMDIDRFKQINDTMGHSAGDKVLCHVAGFLQELAPAGAVVARLGGDEFTIVIQDAPSDSVLHTIAETFVARARRPFYLEGHAVRFGMSVGIATACGKSELAEGLLENADLALYQSKNDGRGRVSFYSQSMKLAVREKRTMADDILAGLDRGEFYCVYQPQFSAKDLSLSGVEALVRWRHPLHGILGPDKFLSVAEELNVVAQIDGAVLDQALFDFKTWKNDGIAVPRISVNVSSRRLGDVGLPDTLDKLGDIAGYISFELLESVFLDKDDPVLSHNIADIRSRGIDIEVDDFGTGHASIVGMLRLQPDRIKIDRQLVGPMTSSEKQRLLVRSILEIGRIQGIGVVAEGVETAEHVDLLRELGCDYLQGFGLAKPMPASEIGLRYGGRK